MAGVANASVQQFDNKSNLAEFDSFPGKMAYHGSVVQIAEHAEPVTVANCMRNESGRGPRVLASRCAVACAAAR